jgi:tetratricopeptide (TPR) repeat protein
MKARRFRIVAVALLTALLPWNAASHTAYQPAVLFVHTDFPDRPISAFAKGRLGIIQSSWDEGYLVVAYRNLMGRPLSSDELQSFLNHSELHSLNALEPLPPDRWMRWPKENNPAQQWVKTRAKYRKDPPPAVESDWWEYTEGERCQSDSFLTAIRTLTDRAKRYGSASPKLQEWITAQDQVYFNCSEKRWNHAGESEIPKPLPVDSNVLAQADRAYQIAAAHFYSGNLKQAMTEFEAIGHDESSPWQPYGEYLVARAAFRAAEPDDTAQFDPKRLEEADAQLAHAAGQTRQAGLRKSIDGLREYIALRLHPDAEYNRLSQRVAFGGPDTNFGQDVLDLEYLMGNISGVHPDFPGVDGWSPEYRKKVNEWENQRFEEIREKRSQSDLVDWLMTTRSETPNAQQWARERWKKTKSLPWLIAALMSSKGSNSEAIELLAASEAITPESAAYPTVSYHRARILREQGKIAMAASLAEDALQHSSEMPRSAVNLLLAERALDAATLDDFVHFLPLQPIGYDNGMEVHGENEFCYAEKPSSSPCEKGVFEVGDPQHLLPQINPDEAQFLNRGVTLDDLIQIARSPSLPDNLRKELAPAVWTRAVILDRVDQAAAIAPTAESVRPELKPYIAQYEAAKGADERHFLAAYAIAHFPGLRPFIPSVAPRVTRFDFADDFRDNWWCKSGLPIECNKWYVEKASTREPMSPAFYSAPQKETAAGELRQIFKLGDCGDWLSNTLIEWAKSHPSDERSPEALHFAMRSIRFSADGTTKRSREIYVMLHSRYPNSEWAKKTRFWY